MFRTVELEIEYRYELTNVYASAGKESYDFGAPDTL